MENSLQDKTNDVQTLTGIEQSMCPKTGSVSFISSPLGLDGCSPLYKLQGVKLQGDFHEGVGASHNVEDYHVLRNKRKRHL